MSIRLLALSAAAVALMGSSAFAADLIVETAAPAMDAASFDWEGLYVGAIGGFYNEDGDSQGFVGGVIGGNVIVSGSVFVGGEVQGNYYFENDAYYAQWEVLGLGKLGVAVSDGFAIYATAGVGFYQDSDDNSGSEYVLGAGIEAAVTDTVSVRADLLAFGYPDGTDTFDGARASVGVFYHF